MNLALISGMPGWLEVLVILLAILLLFGAKRLPELARSLGRSMSEFRKGREEGSRSDENPGEKDKPSSPAR